MSSLTISGANDAGITSIQSGTIYLDGGSAATPNAILASSYMNNGSLSFRVEMDSDTLNDYLSAPATLTFNLMVSGQPESVQLNGQLCVDLNGSVSKSL